MSDAKGSSSGRDQNSSPTATAPRKRSFAGSPASRTVPRSLHVGVVVLESARDTESHSWITGLSVLRGYKGRNRVHPRLELAAEGSRSYGRCSGVVSGFSPKVNGIQPRALSSVPGGATYLRGYLRGSSGCPMRRGYLLLGIQPGLGSPCSPCGLALFPGILVHAPDESHRPGVRSLALA